MPPFNQLAPNPKAERLGDGGHYYGHDAIAGFHPLYGEGKNYGLREARKDVKEGKAVLPSVTTYQKVLHKQMLLDWKMEQVAKAAWAASVAGERYATEDLFVETMTLRADSNRSAADLGTKIHAAMEAAHANKDFDAAMLPYVEAMDKARAPLGIKTLGIETCCGSLVHGYAGKCDEHAEGMTVVDIKSRKSKAGRKVASYSTDEMQLSGYGAALFGDAFFTQGRGIILGVSTTQPGLVTVHEFTGAQLREAFNAFVGLMAVWRYENNFDPRIIA